jgi:hypothetical protein
MNRSHVLFKVIVNKIAGETILINSYFHHQDFKPIYMRGIICISESRLGPTSELSGEQMGISLTETYRVGMGIR